MNLDLRTMMVMISALSLLFSGLLALVGLHAGDIRGVRQWAMAACVSASDWRFIRISGLRFSTRIFMPGLSPIQCCFFVTIQCRLG